MLAEKGVPLPGGAAGAREKGDTLQEVVLVPVAQTTTAVKQESERGSNGDRVT